MGGLVLVTAPTAEPLSVDEAKAHLRLDQDTTDEDALIRSLIIAARRYSEAKTRRAFVTQTWDWFRDEFPGGNGALEVPLPDLISVTSVKYIDTDGNQQTLVDGTDYDVNTKRRPGEVVPSFNASWPSPRNHINVVEVRFVAGYGKPSQVPQNVKAAMKLLIGTLYGFREEIQGGLSLSRLPDHVGANALLGPERVIEF